MKQDQLEQAAKEYAEMHLDVSGNLGKYLVKAVFQDGGKWEQEQDKDKFSEEQVLEMIKLRLKFFGIATTDSENLKWFKWFNQF